MEKWRKIIAHLDQVNPEQQWRQNANCLGLDSNLFMPERGDTHTLRNAQHICAGCPVKWSCLLEGLDEKHGIWGGLSEKQRRQLRPHWDRHSGSNARQRHAS